MSTYLHDPDAHLDYRWDWSEWLATGETITSHTVTPTTGVTVDSHTATTTAVTAWVTAATSGKVVCHVTTSDGRQDDRTITLRVVQR